MNDENLEPWKLEPNSERTTRIAAQGGIASGMARRERKRIREALEELMARDYTDAEGNVADGTTAIAARVMRAALDGNMRAVEFIRDSVDGKPMNTVQLNGNLQHEQAKFNELLEQLRRG